MRVWLVEQDGYEDWVYGVFSSMEKVFESYPSKTWRQTKEGAWKSRACGGIVATPWMVDTREPHPQY